jgi:hypothetical protein
VDFGIDPQAAPDFSAGGGAVAPQRAAGMTGVNWKEIFEQRHPLYAENQFLWTYFADCYAGGVLWPGKVNPLPLIDIPALDLKDASGLNTAGMSGGLVGQARYLWKYPLEKNEKYRHRLQRAVYINVVQPVVDFYAASVGKGENVLLSNDPNYEWFEDDADLQGTSFLQFMAMARINAAVRGHTFLLMDSTSAATPLITEYDVKQQKVRPYLYEILPENMLNWRLDDYGQPLEILFRVELDVPGSLLDKVPSDAQGKGAARKVQYRYWSREIWQVYEQGSPHATIEFKSEGTHKLGKIPLAVLFHKRLKPFSGEGLLKDSAKIGQLMTNWVSALDEAFEVQMFAIPVWTSKVSPTDGGVGVTTVLHLDPEKGEKFEYVTPSTQPFESSWEAFYRMLQLANKAMGISPKAITSGGKSDPQSGVSKEWDFQETEKVMCRMALNEQEAAESCFDLLEAWTGTKWKGSIQYAQNYDLASAQDDINDLISLQSAGLPKTARQELMRRVVAKKMPNLPEDKHAAIQKEIDALGVIPDLPDQMNARGGGEAPPPGELEQVKPLARPIDRANRALVAQQPGTGVQPPAA